MTFSPTRPLLAFICSYSRLTPATPEMWEKKELETVFRLFWNNINQLMMGDLNVEDTNIRAILPTNYPANHSKSTLEY